MEQGNLSKWISVVIPTLNKGTVIDSALAQLGDVSGTWEIVLTDSGSADATLEIIDSFGVTVAWDVAQA